MSSYKEYFDISGKEWIQPAYTICKPLKQYFPRKCVVSHPTGFGPLEYYFELGASIFADLVLLPFPAVEKDLWDIFFFLMATVGFLY
jgi:hypothetical protein